jgi:hypothetical protein
MANRFSQRQSCTICLPIAEEEYRNIMNSWTEIRQWIQRAFQETPELFPANTTALGCFPLTPREVGKTYAQGEQFSAGGLRVARSRLRASCLRVLEFLCRLLKHAYSNSSRQPHTPHHGGHRRSHLAHG